MDDTISSCNLKATIELREKRINHWTKNKGKNGKVPPV